MGGLRGARADGVHVPGGVHAQQHVQLDGVRLDVHHVLEQRGCVLLERAHDRRQAALVLTVAPAGVVPAARRVHDEPDAADGQGCCDVTGVVRFASATMRATSSSSAGAS